jgi:hypothetical protein
MGLDDLARAILTPVIGRFAIGIAGATVIVAGLLQLRLGITAGFRHLLLKNLSLTVRIIIITVGVLGYITLGVLSLMVGYSLVQVAVRYNPTEAGGWEEALWLLVGLAEGRWLLHLASIGLICYGFYFVFQMRYRML